MRHAFLVAMERMLHVPHRAVPDAILFQLRHLGLPGASDPMVYIAAALGRAAIVMKSEVTQEMMSLARVRSEHAPLASLALPQEGLNAEQWGDIAMVDMLQEALAAAHNMMLSTVPARISGGCRRSCERNSPRTTQIQAPVRLWSLAYAAGLAQAEAPVQPWRGTSRVPCILCASRRPSSCLPRFALGHGLGSLITDAAEACDAAPCVSVPTQTCFHMLPHAEPCGVRRSAPCSPMPRRDAPGHAKRVRSSGISLWRSLVMRIIK